MTSIPQPRVLVLAGPNGAGKTTVSRALIRDQFGIRTFVNADTIAQGLAGFSPDAAAIAAGRLMLRQLEALSDARADFAFESTLASRSFAPWLAGLRKKGYHVLLVFLWLPSPELSIQRVRTRVAAGGHHVPADTIRRRFARGIANFHRLYLPLADRWWCYDNSLTEARLVASGEAGIVRVLDQETWQQVSR
jgi:predicted ABC-type ATPase